MSCLTAALVLIFEREHGHDSVVGGCDDGGFHADGADAADAAAAIAVDAIAADQEHDDARDDSALS